MPSFAVITALIVAMGVLAALATRCEWTVRQWARYVAFLAAWPLALPYAILWLRREDGPYAIPAAFWGWHATSMMAVPQWQWERRLVVRQPNGSERVWLVGDDRA